MSKRFKSIKKTIVINPQFLTAVKVIRKLEAGLNGEWFQLIAQALHNDKNIEELKNQLNNLNLQCDNMTHYHLYEHDKIEFYFHKSNEIPTN